MEHSELQSTTRGFFIFADDSTAFGTGKTGLTISATLAKASSTANSVSPTITEVSGGWYWVVPLAAHRDTLGRALWQFSASGAVIAGRVEKIIAANDQLTAFGANTTTPPTAAANADTTLSSLTSGPSTGGNWPNGSFGERILVGDTTTRAVKVTGAGHAAADVHEFQPDVIDSDAIATSAVTKIAAGVWSAASSAYSAATGTMGIVMYAISTMLELVSSVWRWKASSLTQAPTGGGGTGSYAMTITATSSSGSVSGVKFQLVGTSLIATTGTSGVVTFNVDPGTYTLRTTPPSNWESVADSSVTVTASSVSVAKTLTAIAQVPSVIQGAPSASLALRPAMDRKNPLLTLASVVDHLLLLEEINPAEPRSVDRATKAARESLNSFTSYSTQGFRYYESRAKIVLPGSVSLGTITVSNGQFTMGQAFTMPSWAPLAHVRIDRASNKVYPILLVNGQTITVDTLENGTYSNVYMEQLFFPLPRNFRRRGTLSDGKNNYPIEDMSGGSFQSLQDYYRWIGFSELDRRFSAITMDQRNQGDLMLSIWPPFQDRMELSMFFERYPEAMKHHRVGNSAATIGVTGATATSSHAIFDSSHVGAALVIGINNDQELLKSLSSDSLVQTQRIIRYVSSSTQVILDSPVDASLSNRAFYISDIVDVQPGVMTEAYKRLAEYELLRQTKGSKADKKLEEFIRQLQMTQSDDARYKASIDPYNTPHMGYQWGTVTGRPT